MAQTDTMTATAVYKTETPSAFAESIKNPDVFLIDVRTPKEYDEGHISRAKNIDVQNPDFLANAKAILPSDKTVAVYCGTGKRSAMASEQLAAAGYKIINLAGGLAAWNEAGL